jgi:hypothetical protein
MPDAASRWAAPPSGVSWLDDVHATAITGSASQTTAIKRGVLVMFLFSIQIEFRAVN